MRPLLRETKFVFFISRKLVSHNQFRTLTLFPQGYTPPLGYELSLKSYNYSKEIYIKYIYLLINSIDWSIDQFKNTKNYESKKKKLNNFLKKSISQIYIIDKIMSKEKLIKN